MAVNVAGVAVGDYRLGMTFGANDGRVLGTQGGIIRFSDVLSATLDASPNLGDANLRLMDFAVVGGVPILAIAKTNDSLDRIYNVSNPGSPVEVASGTTTSGTLAANGNALRDGRQPRHPGLHPRRPEPGILGLAVVGLALLAKRRR